MEEKVFWTILAFLFPIYVFGEIEIEYLMKNSDMHLRWWILGAWGMVLFTYSLYIIWK